MTRLKTTRGWEGGSRAAPWKVEGGMCEKYHEHSNGLVCLQVKP